MDKIKILGFAGSLRYGSYNKSLLRAAAELLPENSELEIFDLIDIPMYNQDLDGQAPSSVSEFKDKIKVADAILISTPEYNYSIPGVLKNAMDWASRPYGENSFDGKPLAIMGASIGSIATARAQYHLRQTCVYLNMHPINQPEVMVGVAQDKIDNNGVLNDEFSKEVIKALLINLVEFTKKLK